MQLTAFGSFSEIVTRTYAERSYQNETMKWSKTSVFRTRRTVSAKLSSVSEYCFPFTWMRNPSRCEVTPTLRNSVSTSRFSRMFSSSDFEQSQARGPANFACCKMKGEMRERDWGFQRTWILLQRHNAFGFDMIWNFQDKVPSTDWSQVSVWRYE